MRCAIITAPRPGGASYVESTVRELVRCASREAIRVFADALEGPATIEGVAVTYADAEHLARVRRLGCCGSLNFARAADWVAERGHGCVFEDDVELADNWLERAEALAQRADALYAQRWVLALTHFFRSPVHFHRIASLPERHVDLLRWKAVERFWGAQAIMLSGRAAATIGTTIRENIEAAPRPWYGDLAIRNFCLQTGIPLLACDPCLAQHVGAVSTFAHDRALPVSRRFRRAERPADAPHDVGSRVANPTGLPSAALPRPDPPRSRNALCYCGSGLRYKSCHGDPARTREQPEEALRAARERLAGGDPEGAHALCRDILAARPDHPSALRLAARCEYELGRSAEALRLALRAARALQSHPLPPPRAFAVWTELSFMFDQALLGVDSELAAVKRGSYARGTSAAPPPVGAPLVTVAIVDAGDAVGLAIALTSVARQTWRRVEVIVAFAGADPRGRASVVAAIAACPFAIRWLPMPGATEPRLADAAVRAGTGAFANVLRAGDAFAATRLAAMLEATAAQEREWGFSGVAFVDASNRPVAPEQDARVRSWSERLARIAEADTVGFALIHQTFVAVDAGNLFFSCALYERAGGFRDSASPWAWDFALRALWLAEPLYIPAIEYVHRVAGAASEAGPATAEQQAAQIAMFRDYYARACRDGDPAPNPYAPSVAHWRMHFLKAIFRAGHVLALPLPELERLGEALLARLAEPAFATGETG